MGHRRGPATELKTGRQETGCLAMDQESSYNEWHNGGRRERRVSARQYRTNPQWQSVVIWFPDRIFENRKREGGFSQERSPFAFW
jgi:hypothetical protein